MSIQKRLTEDLKTAMKAGDVVTKDTVRLMRSAIQNGEIEKGERLDDPGVAALLAKMAKQYRDSIATFRDAERQDLVEKEERELAVVQRYLPEQMSAEAIRAVAVKVAQEVGASGPGDKGKVMGKLIPQTKDKADGSLVNSVVTELLESLAS